MTWLWFAHLDAEPPGDPVAAARCTDASGAPAGQLAAWPAETRPKVAAVKIDARAIDPAGPAARVSLVLAPGGIRLLFDDPAVQGARRAVLAAARRPPVVSTLVRGDSIFAGALTAFDPADPLRDDPFARILPARELLVGEGLLAAVVPSPAGPVIERYGSGNPWPFDRFERAGDPGTR